MRVVFSKVADFHYKEILVKLSEKWTEKKSKFSLLNMRMLLKM